MSDSKQPSKPKALHQTLGRFLLWFVVGAFTLAALAGIAVLLGAEMNETSAKVLFTTLIVGGFGVVALSGLGLLGRPSGWFGWVTVVIALAGLAFSLWLLWAPNAWDVFEHENVIKTLFTFITAAVFCTVTCPIIGLPHRDNPAARTGRYIALALLMLSALTVLSIIWEFAPDFEDGYRLFGIIWILTALVVIIVPIITTVGKPKHSIASAATLNPQAEGADSSGGAAAQATLSVDSVKQLIVEAERRGLTPDDFVAQLLGDETIRN